MIMMMMMMNDGSAAAADNDENDEDDDDDDDEGNAAADADDDNAEDDANRSCRAPRAARPPADWCCAVQTAPSSRASPASTKGSNPCGLSAGGGWWPWRSGPWWSVC